MIRLIVGEAAVAAPSPSATAKSSEPTPSPVPMAKGIARQKPRRIPCARLIMLFGPGVAVAIRQNSMNGAIESSAIFAHLSVATPPLSTVLNEAGLEPKRHDYPW